MKPHKVSPEAGLLLQPQTATGKRVPGATRFGSGRFTGFTSHVPVKSSKPSNFKVN